jgi:hypothetical protein
MELAHEKTASKKPVTIGKPVIVIDIDGVILDFSKAFADWFNEKHPNYEIDGVRWECPANANDWQFNHPDNDWITEKINEFIFLGTLFPLIDRNIPHHLLNLQKNYFIHLVTNYPTKMAPTRVATLLKYGVPYDNITFTDEHKGELVAKIDPVAVIEDSPKNIRSIVAEGYHVYVPSYWNYVDCLRDEEHVRKNISYYTNFRDVVNELLKIH